MPCGFPHDLAATLHAQSSSKREANKQFSPYITFLAFYTFFDTYAMSNEGMSTGK